MGGKRACLTPGAVAEEVALDQYAPWLDEGRNPGPRVLLLDGRWSGRGRPLNLVVGYSLMFRLTSRTTFTRLTVIAVLILIMLLGHWSTSLGAEEAACPTTAARVLLGANGTVSVDGARVDASQIRAHIQRLTPQPTAICYAVDTSDGNLPSNRSFLFGEVLSVLICVQY
jgi:hypothetical protein